jgi:hypothetical protein
MTALPDVPAGVDPTRPSPVRLYNYFLGGTHNFPVDREAAERLKAAVPDILDAMLANRGFHGRAAIWMAGQGIRQFIDIGAGRPTRYNLHEAVHKVSPDARVEAPGSYLALSHGTYDKIPPNTLQAGREARASVTEKAHLRPKAEVERFFDGLELVPPYTGADRVITYAGLWGAEDIEAADTEGSRGIYCGVARRP